jgi:hypothetical protein
MSRTLTLVLAAVLVFPSATNPADVRAAAPSPAPGNQALPKVAFNGTVFLVVWEDQRNQTDDIYGSRVSASGVVLDPDGIPIATSPLLEWMPSVASDGGDFLVAWSQFQQVECIPDEPCADPDDVGDIAGKRVSGSGSVLDASPITIGGGSGLAQFPHAAAGGGGYLVAWEEEFPRGSADLDIKAAIVSSSGTVTRSATTIVDRPGHQYIHDVAASPTRFVIGWNEIVGAYDSYVDMLDAAGNAVTPSILLSERFGHELGPSLGWDGSTFLATWSRTLDDYLSVSLARRISTNATFVDAEEIVVQDAEGACDRSSAAKVLGLPARFVLEYTRDRSGCTDSPGSGYYTASVSGGSVSGNVLVKPPPFAVSDYAAGAGEVLWVVDVQQPDLSRDIYARRMTLEGVFLDAQFFLVSSTTGGSEPPPPPPPDPGDTTAPTVGVPTHSLSAGPRLGTSSVPVSVGWSAFDTVGVTQAQLQVSQDGGSYAAIPVATLRSAVGSLVPSHRYRFRVRAGDAAGNWSPWRTGAAFDLRRAQETSNAIAYRGSWARRSLSGAYGGYVRKSSSSGASARYTFTGRQVAWVGTKGPTRGRASVYVNGRLVTTIDLWAAITTTRQILFSRRWSTSTTRSIKIVVRPLASRKRVDVDAFVYLR